MNKGYIKIKQTEHHRFVVEVQTVDCNLWLTKHEIADLFNVSITSVSNSLHSILKLGVLLEEEVTRIHSFDQNGKQCQTIIYNLEALIFVSYRIASGEAKAFKEWVMNILYKNTIDIKRVYKGEVVVNYNLMKDFSTISFLN